MNPADAPQTIRDIVVRGGDFVGRLRPWGDDGPAIDVRGSATHYLTTYDVESAVYGVVKVPLPLEFSGTICVSDEDISAPGRVWPRIGDVVGLDVVGERIAVQITGATSRGKDGPPRGAEVRAEVVIEFRSQGAPKPIGAESWRDRDPLL